MSDSYSDSDSDLDYDEEFEWKSRSLNTTEEKTGLEKLCKDLKNTYDVSLIDKMPDQLIYAFQREALKCTFGRPVLSRLIINYYNKYPNLPESSPPVTKFIRGPKNLTVHWSERFNKLVYIFGEFHQTPHCNANTSFDPNFMMNIEDYIHQLLKTTYKFIDFAFEITAMGRKKSKYTYDPAVVVFKDEPLYNMFRKFEKCIATATRHEAECQLGRVHFLDVRTIDFLKVDKISYLMVSFFNAATDPIKIIKLFEDENFIRLLKALEREFSKDDDTRRTLAYFKVFIFSNDYNLIEINRLESSTNLEDKHIAEQICAFMSDEIQRILTKSYQVLKKDIRNILDFHKETTEYQEIKKFDEAFTTVHSVNPIRITEIVASFSNMSKFFVSIITISQDIYCLARLFKTFNLSKEGFAGAVLTDQPSKAHNIIIYAGDTHSQRYRKFLMEYLGFIEVAKTGQSENGRDSDSCINMADIPQPFFSSKSYKKKKVVSKNYDYNYDHVYDDFNFL